MCLPMRQIGVTYIRQGGHQAGHWPTFLVVLAAVIHIRQIKQGLTIQVDRVFAMITGFFAKKYNAKSLPGWCLYLFTPATSEMM